MKYRSRIDIMCEMLDSAQGGSAKMRIMYKSFLSYIQLKEYLSMLLEGGLLEYDKTTKFFTTTEKSSYGDSMGVACGPRMVGSLFEPVSVLRTMIARLRQCYFNRRSDRSVPGIPCSSTLRQQARSVAVRL